MPIEHTRLVVGALGKHGRVTGCALEEGRDTEHQSLVLLAKPVGLKMTIPVAFINI